MIDLARAGLKHTLTVDKYENHRTPADGPPDEVVEVSIWTDYLTGEVITDPERIADLERRAVEQGG